MKTYNNLFNKICTEENFYKAYKNAVKGKSYYKEVKNIKKIGVKKYINNLREEVFNKKYKVSKYTIFNKYTGHKWREIYRLPMKDRIVQHAIMLYLEPIFRKTFILDTYSSIKTRGLHLGLKRVKQCLRKYNYKYCLKLDIHKCYPSIDQQILKDKLSKKFKDQDLLQLLFTIIDSCDKGLPIGNYTSQYFNNFYFSDFDHWIKENQRVKGYFRYCDDIIILENDKQKLRDLLKRIIIKLNNLNVKIKDNYQIFPIEKRGIDFLGYVIRSKYVKVRKCTKINFVHKVSKMNLNKLSKHDINVLGSYWGILKHSDCRNLWNVYTNVKNFKDLNTSKRSSVKELIDIPLTIVNAIITRKNKKDYLKFKCNFIVNKPNKNLTFKNILVGTYGKHLINFLKNLKQKDYPIKTTILINKGFYEFKI